VKLVIVGSGTAVPDGERNSAGYFVEAGDARVLLDCGAGTVHALARLNLPWERMTHLFISHFHVDHCGELASLMFAFKWGMREERTEKLTIIGPAGLDRLIQGLKLAFGAKLFEPRFPLEIRMLAGGESIRLSDTATLSVAKTPHTDESLAARIESDAGAICYTGDTDVSDSRPEFFRESDLLVSECSFEERREGVRHLSIRDAALLAERAEAKRLVVTHFYFRVIEDELKRRLREYYSGDVVIARDGMALEIHRPPQTNH
jgi:ribonuclease BN (tRNA processing enzyme)